MRRQQPRRARAKSETAPLNPVALSLAIWLGLAVTVTGLNRLLQATSAQPADAPAASSMLQ